MLRLGKKIQICVCVFTLSLKLEKRSFHVPDLPRTGKKCNEIYTAHEGRAKVLFLFIRYAKFVGLALPSRRIYKFPSENRKRNLPQDKESKLIHIGHGYMNLGNFSEDILLKPGFHIVVSVVSVVSVVGKKFIGQIEFIS